MEQQRSRRMQIADAAIATLATEGSRGLTHRAVDRTAGLAEGSTSYYYRTRVSLLQATIERLAELDLGDLPGSLPTSVEGFARSLTRGLEQVIGNGRERLVARYELSLEAARRPELRAPLAASAAGLHASITEQLRALGLDRPGPRAHDLLTMVDGFLFDEVTGTQVRPRTDAERRRLVRRMVHAVCD